jgi:hypothetical protein
MDVGQEWLADHGVALLRGTGRLAGAGAVGVDGARHTADHLVGANGADRRVAAAGHPGHPRPRPARRASRHDRAFPTFSEVCVAALKTLNKETDDHDRRSDTVPHAGDA